MSDEKKYKELVQIRIKVAARNGWQVSRNKNFPKEWILTNKNGYVCSKVVHNKKVKLSLIDFVAWLPDYPNDLNAIHQVYMDMSETLRDLVNSNLSDETQVFYDYSGCDELDRLVNASAETRCKVYLMTMEALDNARKRIPNELRTISRRRSNTTKHKAYDTSSKV
jgi:hypothetical protein